MKIGAYYYPEQWAAEQWERDFDTMAAMGMQIVHMGEFAWFSMEPRPGEFQFDWLDRCLELAQKHKIDAILCTPTAAPPIWLIEQHPEILPVDEHGTRDRFGGRRHYCPLSQPMRDATARIVTALAERYASHPAVIGWQMDNEYSSKDQGRLGFDQSETSHRAFRDWLRGRYETIENLNRAWGNRFWNQYYTDFSQILLPPSRDPRYGNPHQCLDASRFWSLAFAQFNKIQADILRPRVGDRFITTNFMPFHLDLNPADVAGDLTLMAWDSYPITGWERNPKDDTYRIADPAAIGLMHDQMASYNGKWGLMELQPGHVNWSGYPVLPYPDSIRLWIWTALAHGAQFVTTYRFRQPRFGIEMFHDGLVEPDGVTPSPGGRQFVQVIEELKGIDREKWNTDPAADPKRTIGLVFDFEQLWWYATLPQARRWNQPRWLQQWYSAATRLGLRVEILHPKKPWPADLKLIVVPGMQMVDAEDVAQMRSFVDSGGHLILTCRTALMDRDGQLWEDQVAKPILDLIGGEVEAYDSLPEQTFANVEMEGKKYAWGVWGDLLYAAEDSKVIAKYADQFYTGAAAVTQCKHKNGGLVTYCGVYAEPPFIEALMERSVAQSGLTTVALPTRVQLIRRGPYRIVLNYQDQPYTASAPQDATFLIGSRTVPPAGVAIWEQAGQEQPAPTEPEETSLLDRLGGKRKKRTS
jgi:beta-galactosidase